jgi:hypothetical protein
MNYFETSGLEIEIFLDFNNIKYENLIPIGSKTRSDFDSTSDYDICLLLNEDLDFYQKSNLSAEIFRY